MERYLNFKDINISASELEELGIFKLFLIRQMSIHYRHLLKFRNMIDKIKNNKIREAAAFYSNPKWLLERYNSRLENLHKLPRNISDIKYHIIFDFDGTITKIVKVCEQKGSDIPTYIYHHITSVIRQILKKDFFDLFYNKNFINYLEFEIVSGGGDIKKVKDFLDNYSISNMFDKVTVTGGVKNKIEEIYHRTKIAINRFIFIVDDEIDLLNLYKLFFIFPINCDKNGRLKKHIETYN